MYNKQILHHMNRYYNWRNTEAIYMNAAADKTDLQ